MKRQLSRRRAVASGPAIGAVLLAAIAAAGGMVAFTPAQTPRHVAPARAATAPSASPSRSPSQSASPPFRIRRIVALGDSVATSSSCGCTPFVSRLARALSGGEHVPVEAENLAVGGATAGQVLAQLQLRQVRRQLAAADLVLVTIGANDLESLPVASSCASLERRCFAPALRQLDVTFPRLLGSLRADTRATARIVVTGYWNVFLDGAVATSRGHAYVANSDSLTRAVNALVAATARAEHALYLDTYALFKGDGDRDDTDLLMGDGDHPNARGHALITRALVDLLRKAGCGC